jgi:hypothetical protein
MNLKTLIILITLILAALVVTGSYEWLTIP